MQNGADALDQLAVLLEKKKAGTRVAALRRGVRPASRPGTQRPKWTSRGHYRAASAVFPPLAELCVAASAAWLTFYIACAGMRLWRLDV